MIIQTLGLLLSSREVGRIRSTALEGCSVSTVGSSVAQWKEA